MRFRAPFQTGAGAIGHTQICEAIGKVKSDWDPNDVQAIVVFKSGHIGYIELASTEQAQELIRMGKLRVEHARRERLLIQLQLDEFTPNKPLRNRGARAQQQQQQRGAQQERKAQPPPLQSQQPRMEQAHGQAAQPQPRLQPQPHAPNAWQLPKYQQKKEQRQQRRQSQAEENGSLHELTKLVRELKEELTNLKQQLERQRRQLTQKDTQIKQLQQAASTAAATAGTQPRQRKAAQTAGTASKASNGQTGSAAGTQKEMKVDTRANQAERTAGTGSDESVSKKPRGPEQQALEVDQEMQDADASSDTGAH